MQPLDYFVGFLPRWNHWTGIFGHVCMWGYTIDDTWFFLDPNGSQAALTITHLHDEVTSEIAARIDLCDTILRLPPRKVRMFPLHGPMTCAAIVGHHFGVRALTPYGLKRRLLAIGAEVIHEAQRGSSGQSGPHQGAQGVGS